MNISKNKGITLIEVLIIIAIITIILSIVNISLTSFHNEQVLKNTTIDMVSLINKAKQNTLSSLDSTNYGVHFDTDKAVLFTGATYSSGASTNQISLFDSKVRIPSSGGLNIGGGSNVVFERLTGDTIGGTITLQLTSDASKQKIITISKTGLVSSN